jgi:hypothetical protein
MPPLWDGIAIILAPPPMTINLQVWLQQLLQVSKVYTGNNALQLSHPIEII